MIFPILLFLMSVAFVLGAIRVAKGPGVLDRILSLDYLSIVGVGALGVMHSYFESAYFLDLALMLALIGFVTAILLAKYVGDS